MSGAPLDGDIDVDVAIIGAGLTGLWTAFYLLEADHALRIVVLERDTVGFGASGRNGGWCSGLMALGLDATAARHGRAAAIAMRRAMYATVDEVGRVLSAEGADADFVKGGTLTFARNEAQHARLHDELDEAHRFGFDETDVRWLSTHELSDRCLVPSASGALYTPHCAAVHPLRLVHAVATAATARGLTIHEHTTVRSVAPRRVATDRGRVRADVVVRAVEGWAAADPARRREIVPLYSLMVGSEPLTDAQWADVGLADRPTFHDARRLIIYGQRTADGRVAFGGRGAPYHFGSRLDPAFDTDRRVRSLLVEAVRELFPVLADVEFPYHWGGPLGVPRDWQWSVDLDRATGLARAGGYVGDGVATANLAGRTLADLITGRSSELTELAGVGHRSRRWEPEPLRWLGVNTARHAAARADAAESSGTGRRHRARARVWSAIMRTVTGRS